jgi:hypothetical protein
MMWGAWSEEAPWWFVGEVRSSEPEEQGTSADGLFTFGIGINSDHINIDLR